MKLEYDLIRSNRRTIGITVERDRRVVVRAPQHAPDEAVSTAVARKRFWIWQKLRDPHKYPTPIAGKEFVPGETFLFLGQNYPLDLVRDRLDVVRFDGSRFQLGRTARPKGRHLFRAWYVHQARHRLSPRAAALAQGMGIDYKRISVRDLRYRWGSCSPPGVLIFNWRIVQAPTVVIDYLIVHELAHVLQPNHSRDFWNIVAVHVPAWEKAREWLKRNGGRLEW